MATHSNRGKAAEILVRAALKVLDAEDMNFTFNRIQDARAAHGMGQAQAGDFEAFRAEGGKTWNWLIEVKQTEHEHLLSYGNFKLDQVARMQVRDLAGSRAIVLVYHSTFKKWKLLPLAFFLERDTSRGSWDLSSVPAGKLLELFKKEFYETKCT